MRQLRVIRKPISCPLKLDRVRNPLILEDRIAQLVEHPTVNGKVVTYVGSNPTPVTMKATIETITEGMELYYVLQHSTDTVRVVKVMKITDTEITFKSNSKNEYTIKNSNRSLGRKYYHTLESVTEYCEDIAKKEYENFTRDYEAKENWFQKRLECFEVKVQRHDRI